MNDLVFNNEELGLKVRTILNDDGSISINAEDTAIGFGWWRTEIKNGKGYHSVMWARMNGYCKEMGFAHECAKDDYIPESLFYRLGMKASNATAEKFQNWLAFEVIPAIRKTGTYTYNQNIYKIKETSLGEVTSFVREIDKVMRDQNSCPYEIAEAFQGICTQFGIQLPENFVNRGVEPVNYITLEEIYNTPDEDE